MVNHASTRRRDHITCAIDHISHAIERAALRADAAAAAGKAADDAAAWGVHVTPTGPESIDMISALLWPPRGEDARAALAGVLQRCSCSAHPALHFRADVGVAASISAACGGLLLLDDTRTQRRPRQRQLGGVTLGSGREGTWVYTVDDVLQRLPRGGSLCAWPFEATGVTGMGEECGAERGRPPQRPRCSTGRDVNELMRALRERRCAVKDIPHEADARYEAVLNERVRSWFARAGALEYAPFDAVFNCMDIVGARTRAAPHVPTHRVLLLRGADGDASMMHQRVTLTATDLLWCAHDVLSALCVIHANDAMHMDVKPQNVLWTWRGSHSSRASGGGGLAGRRFTFVLADYGLASHFRAVSVHMARGGTPSGTEGFISPLLLRNDHENNVYPRVQWLATVAPGAVPGAAAAGGGADRTRLERFWNRYFARQRERVYSATTPAMPTAHTRAHVDAAQADPASYKALVCKADLNSLALTLLHVMQRAGLDNARTLRARPVLAQLLQRLMFFRATDFKSADEALRFCRLHSAVQGVQSPP